MATNFPGSLDNSTSLPYPTATNGRNAPSLAQGQDNQNDAVIATETKLGTGASTPSGSNLLISTGTGTSAWSKTAPTGTIVGTSDTQTLTNKTLTSPTINAPVITNANITTDLITGFTTSNTGTIYGIPITTGVISAANTINGSSLVAASVGSTALATNAVQGNQLASNAITLGMVSISSGTSSTSTSYVLVAGMTVQVTVPAGGRKVELDLSAYSIFASGAQVSVALYRGATSGALTTLIQDTITSTSLGLNAMVALDSPTAGTYYYSVAYKTSNAADAATVAAGAGPAALTLVVKAI